MSLAIRYVYEFYQRINFFQLIKSLFVRQKKTHGTHHGFQTEFFDQLPKDFFWREYYNSQLALKSIETRLKDPNIAKIIQLLAPGKVPLSKKRKRNRTQVQCEPTMEQGLHVWAANDYSLTLPFSYSFPYWLHNEFHILDISLSVVTYELSEEKLERKVVHIRDHFHFPLALRRIWFADTGYAHPQLFQDITCKTIQEFQFPGSATIHKPVVLEVVLNWSHPRLHFLKLAPNQSLLIQQAGKSAIEVPDHGRLYAKLIIEPTFRRGYEDYRYSWQISGPNLRWNDSQPRSAMYWAGHCNGRFSATRPYQTVSTIWKELQVLKDFIDAFQSGSRQKKTKKKKKKFLDETLNESPILDRELGYLIVEFYWPHTHLHFNDWKLTALCKHSKNHMMYRSPPSGSLIG